MVIFTFIVVIVSLWIMAGILGCAIVDILDSGWDTKFDPQYNHLVWFGPIIFAFSIWAVIYEKKLFPDISFCNLINKTKGIIRGIIKSFNS